MGSPTVILVPRGANAFIWARDPRSLMERPRRSAGLSISASRPDFTAKMAKDIRYVWTSEDAKIARGETSLAEQGGFVTPYGIPARCIQPKPEEGTAVLIDLQWSLQGICTWATRFHVPMPWMPSHAVHGDWIGDQAPNATASEAERSTRRAWEWIEWEVPPHVETLGELCADLVAHDSVAFPETFYGNRKRDFNLNAAKILFDYWRNTDFRSATVSAKNWNWSTYNGAPESIPVEASSGARIAYVLRRKQVQQPAFVPPSNLQILTSSASAENTTLIPPPTSTGAGPATVATTSDAAAEVDAYIADLKARTGFLKNCLVWSREALLARSELIRKCDAIRAIARVSAKNDLERHADAVRAVDILDDVLPKARDWLMTQPVRRHEDVGQVSLESVESAIRNHTMDAAESVRGYAKELHEMLFEPTHLAVITNWATEAHAELQTATWLELISDTENASQHDQGRRFVRLCAAMSDAMDAYAECHDGDEADNPDRRYTLRDIQRLLDEAPEHPAATPLDIRGSVPAAVVLSLSGKGVSLAKTLPKFALTLSRTFASWNVLQLGRRKLALPDAAAAARACANEVLELVPTHAHVDGKLEPLREDVRLAIVGRDPEALRRVSEKTANLQQFESSAAKGLRVLFDIIGAFIAIAETKAPTDPLTLVSFLSTGTDCVSVVVGTAEVVLEALEKWPSVTKLLGNAGHALGVLGAGFTVILGFVALAEGIQKGDALTIANGGTAIVSGACAGFCAGAALFGIATGPVGLAIGTLGLAAALASGLISMVQLKEQLDGRHVLVAKALLSDVRTDPVWSTMEAQDWKIAAEMSELVRRLDGKEFPMGRVNEENRRVLRSASFDDGMLDQLLGEPSVGTIPEPGDWTPMY